MEISYLKNKLFCSKKPSFFAKEKTKDGFVASYSISNHKNQFQYMWLKGKVDR